MLVQDVKYLSAAHRRRVVGKQKPRGRRVRRRRSPRVAPQLRRAPRRSSR
ncbi:MAG: hypothetical protein MZV49_09510 [Rhodopseudomonas palustris]|nr:hypothetical protein [Rhodopseudomonas palustris]